MPINEHEWQEYNKGVPIEAPTPSTAPDFFNRKTGNMILPGWRPYDAMNDRAMEFLDIRPGLHTRAEWATHMALSSGEEARRYSRELLDPLLASVGSVVVPISNSGWHMNYARPVLLHEFVTGYRIPDIITELNRNVEQIDALLTGNIRKRERRPLVTDHTNLMRSLAMLSVAADDELIAIRRGLIRRADQAVA